MLSAKPKTEADNANQAALTIPHILREQNLIMNTPADIIILAIIQVLLLFFKLIICHPHIFS